MLSVLETKGLFEQGVGKIGVIIDWGFRVYIYKESESTSRVNEWWPYFVRYLESFATENCQYTDST